MQGMSQTQTCLGLRAYLESEGALSVSEIRVLVGAKHDAQIRHWRDGLRRPKPKTAVALERVTDGRVSRKVWYPCDWMEIWPELASASSSSASLLPAYDGVEVCSG